MNAQEILMDVDDTKSSNSDSTEDGDSSEEQELVEKAKELQAKLSENNYLYNVHIELIDIYRKLGDLALLRVSYEQFYECYPLTPTLWLDWIKDEIKIASTPDQKMEIFKLFDKATEDYLSVDLWIEYAQFSIGVSDLNTTRSIFERGLTAAGLVCDKGSLLWDTLRELEHAHIGLHLEGSEAWKMQVLKLADVFKRQLSVPLLCMENTYMEWQEWCKTLPTGLIDPNPVEYGYKKAKNLLETYKPFEDGISSCDTSESLFKLYKEYIKAVTDPSTVICLYERAALQLCLNADFWFEYCMFSLKLGDLAYKVSAKALRNCPWSEDLWITRMRVLESIKETDDNVMNCFEQGLSSIAPSPGLNLWLAYLEYVHRVVGSPEKLDKLFHQSIEQLGFHNDPSCKVRKWFGRILAHRGDIKAARKIWGSIMSKPENKGSALLWLEYTQIERQYGEQHVLRQLFQKALNSTKDWPQYIMDEWLLYERHFGTLEEVLNCVQKCREVNIAVLDMYKAQEQQVEKEADKVESQGRGRKRCLNAGDNHEKVGKKNKWKEDKKQETHQVTKKHIPVDRNPERSVFVSNIHVTVDESSLKSLFPNAVNIEIVRDKHGKSKCFAYVEFNTQEEVMVALARDREPLNGRPVFISEIKSDKTSRKPIFKYARTAENNKLFVKGLPSDISLEKVRELFKKHGAKETRMAYRKSGQPKGIAYVEFENAEQAENALKETNQKNVNGHIITVAISAPPLKASSSKEKTATIRHARSRLEVNLIPRALQLKRAQTNDETNKSNECSLPLPKSNCDFRDMLLKKQSSK